MPVRESEQRQYITSVRDLPTVSLPADLPLLALRSTIVFPHGRIAVQVSSADNLALLLAHPDEGAHVICVLENEDAERGLSALEGRLGVLARLTDRRPIIGGIAQVTLQGIARVELSGVIRDEVTAYPTARATERSEPVVDREVARALMQRIALASDARAELDSAFPAELPALLRREADSPTRFADLAAARGALRAAEKDAVIQRLDPLTRLEFLTERWEREVARAKVNEEVRQETEKRVDRHHREFFLRQQLQAIKSELGEADAGEGETAELIRRVEEAHLPPAVAAEAKREVERLRALSTASSEHQVLRNYL
jgi:ATP-dependent Lon protease